MQDAWRKATIGGKSRVIENLLAEGADINSLDRYGQTASMLVALHGRDEVVHLLLEKGADRDVTAKYNFSALMLAVINRHQGIARQLVDSGATTLICSSGAPDFAEKTALDLAHDGGLVDLATHIGREMR